MLRKEKKVNMESLYSSQFLYFVIMKREVEAEIPEHDAIAESGTPQTTAAATTTTPTTTW